MKVLVLWANPEGNANLGVSVLAEGAAVVARRALGAETNITFQEFASASDGGGLTRKMFIKDVLRFGWGPIASRLQNFDLILDTGAGDSFTDHYGISRLTQIVYTQKTAKRVGVPLVMMPQTIGPFNTRMGRLLGRSGLSAASAVFTRDSESFRSARRLGFDAGAGYTDVVFALPVPPVSDKRYDILLNISGLLGASDAHLSSTTYRSVARSLISELIAAGRRVTLLAHVVGPEIQSDDWGDNDVPAVRAFAREFGGRVDVAIPKSLDEVRLMAREAQLVIGSRMHACLNSISVGTPAIALAYSRKFAPLMNDLGWKYSVDLRQDSDPTKTVMRWITEIPEAQWRAELAAVRTAAEARTDLMVHSLRGVVDA